MAGRMDTIKKIQKALNLNGDCILVCNSQFYSKNFGCPINVYSVKRQYFDEDRGRNSSTELFKSASLIQIELFLRDLWYELNGWEVPTNNPLWEQAKLKYKMSKEKEQNG